MIALVSYIYDALSLLCVDAVCRISLLVHHLQWVSAFSFTYLACMVRPETVIMSNTKNFTEPAPLFVWCAELRSRLRSFEHVMGLAETFLGSSLLLLDMPEYRRSCLSIEGVY